jgi:hypothetical protein
VVQPLSLKEVLNVAKVNSTAASSIDDCIFGFGKRKIYM